jgi:hypothetical protein
MTDIKMKSISFLKFFLCFILIPDTFYSLNKTGRYILIGELLLIYGLGIAGISSALYDPVKYFVFYKFIAMLFTAILNFLFFCYLNKNIVDLILMPFLKIKGFLKQLWQTLISFFLLFFCLFMLVILFNSLYPILHCGCTNTRDGSTAISDNVR